jgi:hypothetical protein
MNDKTQISPEALTILKSNRACTVDSVASNSSSLDLGGE